MAVHRTPSVGGVVKKILKIYPELDINDLIAVVKSSIYVQDETKGEFERVEIIDEERALKLAKTLVDSART